MSLQEYKDLFKESLGCSQSYRSILIERKKNKLSKSGYNGYTWKLVVFILNRLPNITYPFFNRNESGQPFLSEPSYDIEKKLLNKFNSPIDQFLSSVFWWRQFHHFLGGGVIGGVLCPFFYIFTNNAFYIFLFGYVVFIIKELLEVYWGLDAFKLKTFIDPFFWAAGIYISFCILI